ncbi:MAG: alpha/beta hydrolase [Clostridia bacterium]|nr:alpha/beta hydrolase [Clostridia bacterium]
MTYQTIRFAGEFSDAVLEAYIHEPYAELQIKKRKAIIICPGGGYTNLSEREGEPIALQYFAAGLNAFVLRYSVKKKAENHTPLIESCLAIKYLREHTDELYVDPDNVFIIGFSAGGHLAAWAGTMWHCPQVAAHLKGADPALCKPTATLPCYPVISSDFNSRSIAILSGDQAEAAQDFSLERLVDEQTSPAFIWHTAEDAMVPVMHSVLYASALVRHSIPFELHIFPKGPHGLALCNKETWIGNPAYDAPYVEPWMSMSIRWITDQPFRK